MLASNTAVTALDIYDGMPATWTADFYSKLHQELDRYYPAMYDDVRDALDDLLRNNLHYRLHGAEEQHNDHPCYFWGAKVSDEEMPWDMNETDW